MFLVGPNGSGKSNFLDALRFVTESLRSTMDQALRERGGIKEVRRRSRGHPNHFSIELEMALPGGEQASYGFRVGAKPQGGFEVQEEKCRIGGNGAPTSSYEVKDGVVQSATFKPRPRASTDRLYLTIASGFPEFHPLFVSLSNMGFYSINPERLRDLQEPDEGTLLLRDGRNLASVVAWLESQSREVKERIEEYLGRIAPGVQRVDKKSLGHKETLEFKQTVAGDGNPWSFLAQNMSDGTLRALGVLVSVFQCFDRLPETAIPLVGIEEPESTHPAAARILMGALQEASNFAQVLVTSHSPDLLDATEPDPDSLLVVNAVDGETSVTPADDAARTAMRDCLYTPGELLRMDQLRPRPKPMPDPAPDPAPDPGTECLPLFPDEP